MGGQSLPSSFERQLRALAHLQVGDYFDMNYPNLISHNVRCV